MSTDSVTRSRWAKQDGRGLIRRLITGVASQSSRIGANVVKNILIVPFFLSTHGVDGYTDWIKIFATATLFGFMSLGQKFYYGYLIRITAAKREFTKVNQYLEHANSFFAGCYLFTFFVLLIFTTFVNIVLFLNIQTLERSETAIILILLTFSMLVQTYRDTLRAIYTAFGDFARSETIQATAILFLAGLQIIALMLGASLLVIAILQLLVIPFLTCGLAWWEFRRRYEVIRWRLTWPRPCFARARLRSLVEHGVVDLADRIFVSAPTVLLGIFNIASELILQFNLARIATFRIINSRMIGQIFAIEMTRQRIQEDWRGFRRLHFVGSVSVGAFGGGMLGVFFAAWPVILPLWTQSSIQPDMILLLLILIERTFQTYGEHASSLLRFGGQIDAVARLSVWAAVAFVGLGLPGLAFENVYGMVVALIVVRVFFFYLAPPIVLKRRIQKAGVGVSIIVPFVVGLVLVLPSYWVTELLLGLVTDYF